MAFAPGKNSSVSVTASIRPFDAFSFRPSCDKADVSDFDRQSAKWLPGLPMCEVTMSGPYSVGALGMQVGQEYAVVLAITAMVGAIVTVLVTQTPITVKVRDAARVEVTGVVTSDFLTEPTIVAL